MPSHQDLEYGRLLFAKRCSFTTGAVSMDGLPSVDLPEVAFAGRSNVGKSSLINALTGHTRLAHTSRTPGRTQQINFFTLGKNLQLVDLPGHGFAHASKKSIQCWSIFVQKYLEHRQNLRQVCLLIDTRRGFMDSDQEIMHRLDKAGVTYQIILTKADLDPNEVHNKAQTVVRKNLAHHPASHPAIITTSSKSGIGIPELRAALALLAQPF